MLVSTFSAGLGFCYVLLFYFCLKEKMQPDIIISSKDSLYDAPISISIRGLNKNQLITLHSFTTIDNGNCFECVANYTSDDNGCISLQTDPSVGGCYTGIEPMGPFWAMKPSPLNSKKYARFAKMDVTTPLVVKIFLYDCSIQSAEELHSLRTKGQLDEHKLASISFNRWLMVPGTKRIKMTMESDGIYGTLFVPPGKGPFPGVITMFGGYPGTMEYKAALLASHGFAAVALSFIGLPGLPSGKDFESKFNLEYFEKAVDVLSQREEVAEKNGIGVIGLSLSSYIVLAMGERLKKIKCVIIINGFLYPMFSSLSYKNDFYANQEFNGEDSMTEMEGTILIRGRNLFPKHVDPFHPELDKSKIKFYDRHDVAYMLISGLSDCSVPSEYFINQAEKLLKSAKHPNYQLLRYPGAGHLIEPCYGILNEITENKMFSVYQDWGGCMIPHCKAQQDSWLRQIDFLKSNLTCQTCAKL